MAASVEREKGAERARRGRRVGEGGRRKGLSLRVRAGVGGGSHVRRVWCVAAACVFVARWFWRRFVHVRLFCMFVGRAIFGASEVRRAVLAAYGRRARFFLQAFGAPTDTHPAWPRRVMAFDGLHRMSSLGSRGLLLLVLCRFDRLKREASSAVCAVGGWPSLLLRNGMVTLWAAFYLRISLRRAVACGLSLRLFVG